MKKIVTMSKEQILEVFLSEGKTMQALADEYEVPLSRIFKIRHAKGHFKWLKNLDFLASGEGPKSLRSVASFMEARAESLGPSSAAPAVAEDRGATPFASHPFGHRAPKPAVDSIAVAIRHGVPNLGRWPKGVFKPSLPQAKALGELYACMSYVFEKARAAGRPVPEDPKEWALLETSISARFSVLEFLRSHGLLERPRPGMWALGYPEGACSYELAWHFWRAKEEKSRLRPPVSGRPPSPLRKLSPGDVREIRASEDRLSSLAHRHDVTVATICKVKAGTTYREIK